MTLWNHIKCQVMLSSIRFVSKATILKPLSVRRYYVTANYISALLVVVIRIEVCLHVSMIVAFFFILLAFPHDLDFC